MYIATRSKCFFRFNRIEAEQVRLIDMARSLARIARFTGQTDEVYSVCAHCLSVANYLERRGAPPEVVLGGLLHDVHEAFFGDISSPLKVFVGQALRDAEAKVQDGVLTALGVPLTWVHLPEVVLADRVALWVEATALFDYPLNPQDWGALTLTEEQLVGLELVRRDGGPDKLADEYVARAQALFEVCGIGLQAA